MNSKAEINLIWLRDRGYTISGAARVLNVHPSHVNRVLAGKRVSISLKEKLLALPQRRFVSRESISK